MMKQLSFQLANTNFEYFFIDETFMVEKYKDDAQLIVRNGFLLVLYCRLLLDYLRVAYNNLSIYYY